MLQIDVRKGLVNVQKPPIKSECVPVTKKWMLNAKRSVQIPAHINGRSRERERCQLALKWATESRWKAEAQKQISTIFYCKVLVLKATSGFHTASHFLINMSGFLDGKTHSYGLGRCWWNGIPEWVMQQDFWNWQSIWNYWYGTILRSCPRAISLSGPSEVM